MSILKGKFAVEQLLHGIECGPNKVLRLVSHDRLHIDHSYQRDPITSNYERIANDFNPDALGLLQVCQRRVTNLLNVVDGQNRLKAVQLRLERSEPAPTELLCLITLNTTREQEAKLFVDFNTNKQVGGNPKFKANLVYKQQPEVSINKIIEEEGFKLTFLPAGKPMESQVTRNGIYSVGCLLKAFNTCEHHFQPAVRLLKQVWGKGRADRVPFALRSGQVIYGLSLFLFTQADKGVTGITKYFKNKDYVDLGQVWDGIKKQTGSGWNRPKALAERLQYMVNGSVTPSLKV